MYAIPIAILILAALIATAWSPVFALVIAVPLILVFFAYIGFRPRADEQVKSPLGEAAPSTGADRSESPWGDERPDPSA
jgi:hypothetical protein